MIDVFDRLDVSRLIFHRKNSFADMESVIRHEREKGSRGVYEFEAFALNESVSFRGRSVIPCTATRWGICAGYRIR